jgi:hypothetical protein
VPLGHAYAEHPVRSSGPEALVAALSLDHGPTGRKCPVPCATDAEWRGWSAYNRRTAKPARFPCVDCTPEFAAEMWTVGRCDGSPGMTTRPRPPFVGRRGRVVLDPTIRVERRRASWRAYGVRRRANPEWRERERLRHKLYLARVRAKAKATA